MTIQAGKCPETLCLLGFPGRQGTEYLLNLCMGQQESQGTRNSTCGLWEVSMLCENGSRGAGSQAALVIVGVTQFLSASPTSHFSYVLSLRTTLLMHRGCLQIKSSGCLFQLLPPDTKCPIWWCSMSNKITLSLQGKVFILAHSQTTSR